MIRKELGERHMTDLSSLTKPLEQQLQAARAQLESAQDAVKSKEKEFRHVPFSLRSLVFVLYM